MEVQLASTFRDQLIDRRQKLERAMSQAPSTDALANLLQEVDAALERMEQGTYGLCETCHDAIELERLGVERESATRTPRLPS